jgi:ABC-type transport system involved in multi-copper enzyme maturation permease subunit
MKLSAPSQVMFLIAIVLAALGVVGKVAAVAMLAGYAFWLLLAGFVVLAAGCLMKGM